jgi:hypothetical protein
MFEQLFRSRMFDAKCLDNKVDERCFLAIEASFQIRIGHQQYKEGMRIAAQQCT